MLRSQPELYNCTVKAGFDTLLRKKKHMIHFNYGFEIQIKVFICKIINNGCICRLFIYSPVDFNASLLQKFVTAKYFCYKLHRFAF